MQFVKLNVCIPFYSRMNGQPGATHILPDDTPPGSPISADDSFSHIDVERPDSPLSPEPSPVGLSLSPASSTASQSPPPLSAS